MIPGKTAQRFFMPVVLAGAVLALATASVAADLPPLWNAAPPGGVSAAPSGPVVGPPGEFDTGTLATNEVWDNFDGAAGSDPDGRLWLEDTINQGGTQVYDPARSFLDGNGNAVLEAIQSGGTIQSGRFTSRTKFNMQYGWCAARIKFPKAGQAWFPAFWLLFVGYNTGAPYGEIDMMEFFGDTNTYATHVYFEGDPSLSSMKPVPASHSGGDAGDGFHTYWMQWEEDRLWIGVDDLVIGDWSPDSISPASAWESMRQPFYFIANFAVAPSWLPAPQPSDFPARMEIDWIWYKPLTASPDPNQPPAVSFIEPTDGQAFAPGSDVYAHVDAVDSDGSIQNVQLYLDGALVRQEGSAPYEWGAASQNDTALASLAAGTYVLLAVATDDDGATGQAEITITVSASVNAPPVADAGGDITVWDTNLDDAADVDLDGAASYDPDGSIASHVWAAGATQLGSGATPTVSLPVGTHALTLTVTDDEGATDSDSLVVTVHFQDDDGDGIADTWEIAHFGGTSGADQNSDADDDDVSDLGEFLVGSDPHDPGSPGTPSGDDGTGFSCSGGAARGGPGAALLVVLLSLGLTRRRPSSRMVDQAARRAELRAR